MRNGCLKHTPDAQCFVHSCKSDPDEGNCLQNAGEAPCSFHAARIIVVECDRVQRMIRVQLAPISVLYKVAKIVPFTSTHTAITQTQKCAFSSVILAKIAVVLLKCDQKRFVRVFCEWLRVRSDALLCRIVRTKTSGTCIT